MKNILIIAVLVLASAVASQAQTVEATVKTVTGDAYVTLPGASGKTALTEGEAIPVNSVITTGSDSQVILSPFPGSGVVIDENSTVTVNKLKYKTSGSSVSERAADLGLDEGSVTAAFAPGMEDVTDFKIHGGGAVAAARGCALHFENHKNVIKLIVIGGKVYLSVPGHKTVLVFAGSKYEAGVIAKADQAAIEAAFKSVLASEQAGASPHSATEEAISDLKNAGIDTTGLNQALSNYANQVKTADRNAGSKDPNTANTVPPTVKVIDQTTKSGSQ